MTPNAVDLAAPPASFTVNGCSVAITLSGGATVTVGVQQRPGNPNV